MNRLFTILLLCVLSACLPSCSFYRFVRGKKSGEGKKITLVGADSNKTTMLPEAHRLPDGSMAVPHDSAWLAAHLPKATPDPLIAQLTPLWNKRLDFTTFSTKAKIRFESPDSKHELTAHIRVRKDSLIWINVTAALGGIPVARILITRDSFFMRNDIDKEMMMVPLTRAVRILPGNVDYASLQNLIMGEPLRNGDITHAKSYPDSLTLQVEDVSYVQHITYSSNDSLMRQSILLTHNPAGPEASTEYNNYEQVSGRFISTLRYLVIHNGNDTYLLDMNFTKLEFDAPQDFPFSIPPSYSVKQ